MTNEKAITTTQKVIRIIKPLSLIVYCTNEHMRENRAKMPEYMRENRAKTPEYMRENRAKFDKNDENWYNAGMQL